MKRRILKAISLICTCVMLLTLAACGEESQDNTGKYIVFKFGNDNIYLDEVYIYAQTTIDEYEKEYGNDIWGKTIETDGGIEMNVEEMARREVISNIVQTKALIAQADEYKISLTAEEQAQAETSDEKMPYLIRKKTGEIISLNKQTFIIGKLDTCCDYVIRGNRAISRLHAVIKYKEDTDVYFIVDCNSTNHIYLNGRQIEAEQPETLEDGMHIHLALEEFVFQLK